ncbi:MAG: ABC transporter permease [Gemmataceae bacterium]|nr:ABC transporter permease [Gemmataceae bacterium]
MRATMSLLRREFSAYFLSPIGYVVFAVFLAVTGHLFSLSVGLLTARGPKGLSYPMQLMVNDIAFWLVYLFIPPLLTMRLFAEERSTGTLEILLSAPLRDGQIVMSKFLACYGFYVLLWLPTLLYLPVLLDWQWWTWQSGIDPWPVVTTYFGLALAGAMFLSVGMLVSSLVKTQMVAALVTLFIGLLFILAGLWRPADMDTSGLAYQALYFFTVPLHFERNFSRGLIDTRNVVLYVSVTLFCLFLAVRSLESRRWR